MTSAARPASGQVGKTEIAQWQYGKRAAVSLTFDDGSINQFQVAVPLLNGLGLPATFFIITGNVAGSQYHGVFLGRPTQAIIQESASTPTNKDNFFERASAIGYLGYQGTLQYHSRAGELYEEGEVDNAYRLIDEAYAKVRMGSSSARREILLTIAGVLFHGTSCVTWPSKDMRLRATRSPMPVWQF